MESRYTWENVESAEDIYKKVESSVLLGDSQTDWFEINVGLRQGCILSPLLFNLFINDLRKAVEKLKKGIKCGNRRISMLFFADDVVILAESKEDLELMLKAVYEWSIKWRCKFNYDKCNVVTFDNVKIVKLFMVIVNKVHLRASLRIRT